MNTIVFFYLLIVSLMFSCGGNQPSGRVDKPADIVEKHDFPETNTGLIRIVAPPGDGLFYTGDEIRVRYELTGRAVPDSVEVYYSGRLCKTLVKTDRETLITAGYTARAGTHTIKLLAYTGNERSQSVSTTITLLSDLLPERYSYRVEYSFPHDNEAYTQGLLYYAGLMYEGTGQEGRSSLRKVELETGNVLMRHNLESRFFGEGIAIVGDQIYQLTWQTKTGFVYDRETFRELGRFYYNTEGWGLTTMGDRLVMSDGSNKLYFVTVPAFNIVETIEVYDNKSMVNYLNELEYINGEIWANIYLSDKIARIDPETGRVKGYIDMTGILSDNQRGKNADDVLNGIAWDESTGRIFVTGKNWPKLFQIKVVKQR